MNTAGPRQRLLVGSMVALLATACGGGDDSSDDAAVETGGDVEHESEDASGCLLDAEAAGAAVEREVTSGGFTSGGTGGGSGSASLDVNGAEATTESSYSVAWVGCEFVADDGTEYMVAQLVGEDGSTPDLTGFGALIAWAEAESEQPEMPAIGDDAFFDDEELVVQDGGRTLVVGYGSGAPAEPDLDALTDIAAGAVGAGDDSLANICDAAFAAAPGEWGELGPPLQGGGGEMIDGVELSYESCSVRLPDGAQLRLKLGEAQWHDLLRTRVEEQAGDVPELVSGIGDEAVRMKGRLYVRMGDRGIVTSVTTPDDEPGDPDHAGSLAQAAIDSFN